MGTVASYALAVERVIQAMRAQLAEPLSLEEMAEIACLSPFHFNRVFRSITNIPPGEFLAVQRLDAAKRLLLTTSLSVTDVCFELGYTSLGTFTTRFKQLAGMSPLQLRQLAGVLAFTTVNPRYAGYPGAQRLTFLRDGGVYGVRGSITAPGPLSGLIFIGLFPRPIPQGRPLACTVLPAPGAFHIHPVPDGRYYLFAAALPQSQRALAYLVPTSGLLVAKYSHPVIVQGGRAHGAVALALRPPQVTDPPVLALPPLLATPIAVTMRDMSLLS
jgi:AraC-like DNA-binding protein